MKSVKPSISKFTEMQVKICSSKYIQQNYDRLKVTRPRNKIREREIMKINSRKRKIDVRNFFNKRKHSKRT